MTADEYITRWKAEEGGPYPGVGLFPYPFPLYGRNRFAVGLREHCAFPSGGNGGTAGHGHGRRRISAVPGASPGQDERDGRISSQRRAVPADAGFSVDACAARLLQAQGILEERGAIQGTIHRYLIVARRTGAQSKTE